MTRKNNRTSFDIKSTNLALISFILKSSDLSLLQTELEGQFGQSPHFFEDEPVAIDLSAMPAEGEIIHFTSLIELLKNFRMKPFAICGGTIEQQSAAKEAGLLITPVSASTPSASTEGAENMNSSSPAEPSKQSHLAAHKTMLIDYPLRSGQQVYARGGDLIVTAPVNHGAEVIADGNIHVYAPLRGRVIAGAQGDTEARIFSTCFEPDLYSIAGVFQTTDKALPPEIQGQAVTVYLEENSLITAPIKAHGA